MKHSVLFLAGLALPFGVAGCAAGAGNYPSLAIRDAERISGTAPPVEAEPAFAPPAPVSADTDARIAQATANARAAHKDFLARSEAASRVVAAARGISAPGDQWIRAHVELAGLQSLRSRAVIALADLDELYARERIDSSGDMTPTTLALTSAREQIGEWVAQEDKLIALLATQLQS